MSPVYHPYQRIDHSLITRILGSGGASCVYLARDQQSLQEVILKFPAEDQRGGVAIFNVISTRMK